MGSIFLMSALDLGFSVEGVEAGSGYEDTIAKVTPWMPDQVWHDMFDPKGRKDERPQVGDSR
ncbi:hypothetical protein [Woodsholea maritima]|uniref:hypothetical protein n=1 Tax=Woodsholea maritima TaxID=240237 RepID=UPI0003717555|nr:hypothetical protein [Woodsholea maritima]